MLAAIAVAVGLVAHLLRPAARSAASPAPVADRPASAERDEAPRAATLGAAEPDADAVRPAPPSVAELESELAAHPDQVLHKLAQAIPRGEREAQRLTLLEVRAFVARGEIASARASARGYFERWPGGPDTAALEQLTGAHPTDDAARP